jgi:hypothetical protein
MTTTANPRTRDLAHTTTTSSLAAISCLQGEACYYNSFARVFVTMFAFRQAAFARPLMLRSRSLHHTPFRASIFSRNKVTGDQGLRALSVPTQSQASSTFRKIAFYVKLVRVPFLVVAIYGLGYRQGITDTVRNPLKLQQVSFWFGKN